MAGVIPGFDGCLVVFSVLFFHHSSSGRYVHGRVPVTHLLQNVNLGHNKWNICKAPGVISANCILILAIMGGTVCAESGGRMETSGDVDGGGWIEMGHDQLRPSEQDEQ